MEHIIHAKNTTVTPAIKDYVEKRFAKFNKYAPADTVVYTKIEVKDNGNRHKVEVTINFGKQTLRAEANDKDMYAAIDAVEKTMARLLKRRKEKFEDKHKHIVVPEFTEANDNPYAISKVKTHKMIEMTVSEACEAMEMVGHPFYVYMDSDKKKPCAVYVREDGTYGQLIYD